MTRTEISRRLRPHRRVLVVAAEAALDRAYANGDDTQPPSKTQFSRLVNLCGEATCAEELENYLRYQAGRSAKGGRDDWRMGFVDIIVKAINEALEKEIDLGELGREDQDLARVEAWRLYATYLARAYTYRDAVAKSSRYGGRHAR
ncbi:MAG: hypothetical protein H6712_00925 [Myxococcales bacterium]|nr:hypothetical protein [Myxococcales bacterium]